MKKDPGVFLGHIREFVWQAATKDFPELKAKIQKIPENLGKEAK